MSEVTLLLDRWRQGDQTAMDILLTTVYEELRGLARSRMRLEATNHTLQPTALIHELFFQLLKQNRIQLQNRAQFFALAARIMRRILVDHARTKHAQKRGGLAAPSLQLTDLDEPRARCGPDPLVLDDALISLAKYDADLCLLVELKHFGGFNMEEIAQIQGKPVSTIYRHWKIAKTLLYQYFKETAVGF